MLTWTQIVGMINHMLVGRQQANEANAVVATEEISHIQARSIRTVQMKREAIMHSNSKTLIEEICQALDKQELSSAQPTYKNEILSEIQSTFIKGNPRARWSSLLSKPKVQQLEDNTRHLHLCELVPPPAEDVWLIADEDNEEKFVFSVPLMSIPSILDECRYFEYYITDKKLSWMIAENDHGDLIFCNAPEQTQVNTHSAPTKP